MLRIITRGFDLSTHCGRGRWKRWGLPGLDPKEEGEEGLAADAL